MNILFISADRIKNESINYWFDVDGHEYAISVKNGKNQLLDCDGYPIDDCNDHDNILALLSEIDLTKLEIN